MVLSNTSHYVTSWDRISYRLLPQLPDFVTIASTNGTPYNKNKCFVFVNRYRMAFHETLLCKHRTDRNSFQYSRRETTMSTCARPNNKSSFYKESRILSSKVDFVKDESPFCVETKIDENTIYYFPNGDHSNLKNDHDTLNT